MATLTVTLVACGGTPPPEIPPPEPGVFSEPTAGNTDETPPPPPPRPPAPPTVPMDPTISADRFADWSLEEINQDSPLLPAFFTYDSDTLTDAARDVLTANAEVLRAQSSWVITIEGHCDERGTAEYNLALGDRRALSAKNFLLSLGVTSERVRTVSYGKEFPFDPNHDEGAWTQNRRAHFMVVSK
jgi:peptidoglycan-associated lipoprotein